MKIVQGRGNNRRVTELPCGSIFAQAAKSKDPQDQRDYRAAHHAICETLGVPHNGRI